MYNGIVYVSYTHRGTIDTCMYKYGCEPEQSTPNT